MATQEEMMLIFDARDNASKVADGVAKSVSNMAASIQQSVSHLSAGFMNISTLSDEFIGSLNSGKSASDIIFGTTSKAETNRVLIDMMTQTEAAAEDLFKTVDKVTDSSLTSMQDLIPALNAFKSATGASDEEIKDITDDMANFGAAVLAQTGSTELAETAMMSLSKGIGGAFASLDQYGVSEEALKRTGKWSGDEKDVRGFMAAVTETIGSTEKLMQTNQGLDALIQKAFSRGGKKIGNEFLPILKDVKRGFIDLDNALGGNLTASILVAGASLDYLNKAFYDISIAGQGIREIRNGISALKEWANAARNAGKVASDATGSISGMSNAMASVGNATAMGADVTGMGTAGAGVAEATKNATKTEKAVNTGGDALLMADMLQDRKTKNKISEELLKETRGSSKFQDRLQKEIDSASKGEGKVLDLLTKKSSLEKDISSGAFGKVMTDQLKAELKNTEKEIDTVIGTDMWSGVRNKVQKATKKPLNLVDEFAKSSRDEVGSHSKGFLLDRLFGSKKENPLLNGDLNKRAKEEASDTLKAITSIDKDKDAITKEMDLIFEKSGWGLTDVIKNPFKNLKESISNAFKGFDLKSILTTPLNKLKGFDFGGKLQNVLKTGFSGLGDVTRGINGKLSSFADSIRNLKMPDIRGKLSALNKNLGQSVMDFDFKKTIGGIKDKLSGLRGVSEIAEEAKDVTKLAEGLDVVGDAASAVGAAAPAMEAGAAGAEATAVASTTLAGAFTSMIVPVLAIAAVIIIMIPIIAVIAAEAMIFIKLLGELMQALNFDSIDVSKSVESIKKIAEGLAYIGAAMLAMTAVSLLVGINSVITLFTGITGPLETASKALKTAATQLDSFKNVQIDASVADKIKSISESLKSVSDAMMAMTSVTVTTGFSGLIAWVFKFKDIGSALDQAKTTIMEASSKLKDFANLTPIDAGTAQNIQNVCDSLGSVGKAMEGLRSIRDSQNWDDTIGGFLNGIFHGVDIQTALTNVKGDIEKAAEALKTWGNIEEIPQDIGDKIGRVSSALEAVSNAFNTLRSIRDNSNWDGMMGGLFPGGTDIQGVLTSVIKDIQSAAEAIKNINIEGVDDAKVEGLGKVASAISKVVEISSTLSTMPTAETGTFDPNTLTTAITTIQTAADSMKNINVDGIDDAKIEGLGRVSTAISKVIEISSTLATMPTADTGTFDPASITTAITTIQTAATELGKLSTVTFGEGGDPSTMLGTINNAITGLRDTLSNLAGGFAAPATNIGTQIVSGIQSGLSGLGGVVQSSVSSGVSSASGAASSGGQKLGSDVTNGFKSNLKLAEAMSEEMSHVVDAVNSGIEAAKSAASSGAADVVAAFKSGYNPGSPGDIAKAMAKEMNYTVQAITDAFGPMTSAAYELSSNIVSAFGNPSLTPTIDSFTPTQLQDMNRMNQTVTPTTGQSNQTTIIFQENSMPIDARNMTSKEAQQMLILALESLDLYDPNRGA